tara:strand:- start:1896 stop:2108 length:213 start_codon:yes stop_codon:yes gene_type:complete
MSKIVVKFASVADGVFIEQTAEAAYSESTRCFRFDEQGNAEYALYCDIMENGAGARFFGHIYNEKNFLFA